MKAILWMLGLITFILIGLYLLLFTGLGNTILQPIVEKNINTATGLNSKFTTFSVSYSEFEIRLALDDENIIYAKGIYSLSSKSFNFIYNVKLKKLENLNILTKKELQGPLFTSGSVDGDMKFIKIDGKSNVVKSDTNYHLELDDFKVSSIVLNTKDADLGSLLVLTKNKYYADAKIDLNLNFNSTISKSLSGDVQLVLRDGKLNTKLVNEELDINIEQTVFSMNLDAKLQDDAINYKYILKSNMAKIDSDGTIYPEPLKVNSKFMIDIEELALLKPITKKDLRGPLKIYGTIKGDRERMIVDGKSDVASSDTVLKLILKDLKPFSLTTTMKHVQLKRALYMFRKPQYADGNLDVEANITNMQKGQLQGTIVTNITRGLINSQLLTKEKKFKTKMPKTTFTLSTKTDLDGEYVDTKLRFKSNLANLDIDKIRMNLKKHTIVSDYVIMVPELKKIYFLIERDLEGSLKANGEFSKTKENIDVILHSKIAGGDLKLRIHNDDFHAELKSIQTKAAMKILKYPPVFQSSLNGVLEYNKKDKIGKFTGKLIDGGFENNMVFELVEKYAKIDLYKQKFKGGITADINKEKVLASFNLASNTSSIRTVNTKINSLTQTIDSKIEIVANKHPVSVILSGNKSKPKISIDADQIVKDKIKQEIGSFLQNLF